MKKLIRTATFETNSSSCHSLTMGNLIDFDLDHSIIPSKDGIIYLACESDYYTGDSLNTPIDKLTYYIADNVLGNYPSTEQCLYENLKTDFAWNLLEGVIKSQTGAKEVRLFSEEQEQDIKDGSYTPDFTIIDHESVGLLDELNTATKLYSFIFNPESFIYLDYNG